MQNKLLITTALAELLFVTQVKADIYTWTADQGTVTISNETDNISGGTVIFVPGPQKISVGENSVFSGNKADIGGAIAISKLTGYLSIGANTQFLNNEAKYDGGAIGNYGGAVLTNNVVFKGNKAQTSGTDYQAIGGGAISLDIDAQTEINNSIFESNTSGYSGGAIAMRKTLQSSEVETGNTRNKVTITNSKFTGNKALGTTIDTSDSSLLASGNGGAIANNFATTTVSNTVFENNEAKNWGGAISNMMYENANSSAFYYDKGGYISITDSTFTNNVAGEEGGAIYNMKNAGIQLSGINVFSGNKANGKLNDIHNDGSIEVSGSLTLDGGISGEGTITFLGNNVLTVNTSVSTIANTVINGGGSVLILNLDNGYTGEYKMITGSLDREFYIVENNIYDIKTTKTNGTYEISKKSSSEISHNTGANSNQTGIINAVTDGNAGSEVFDNIANNINTLLQSYDEADVQTALNAATALAPEVAPVVQSVPSETVQQVFDAVSSRLTGGSVSAASQSQGLSSGDSIFDRAAIWVQGLFNKSKLDDTSKAKGFDADTKGMAFGVENNVTDTVKAGVGYAYTKTDIDGFMRSTDVNTHTAIVYGEYKPSKWYVNGIATYGWSDCSEKKNVAGIKVKADYDVKTFGLQAMAGYDMNVKGFGVIPEAGVRYLHIQQKSYTDTADQKVSANDSDILTGVIGAKVHKDIVFETKKTVIRPEVRIAATYDMKNDDISSVVTLANGSVYNVKGEALDRFGMECGVGISAFIKDNVELSLSYEGKFRKDYQDHSALINAKYHF